MGSLSFEGIGLGNKLTSEHPSRLGTTAARLFSAARTTASRRTHTAVTPSLLSRHLRGDLIDRDDRRPG
jgi:hypothetical protein